jgi:hypothetical protein
LPKISAFFARALILFFKAFLILNSALNGKPIISSDVSPLRPVFVAGLRVGFGRGNMSVTLIYFSRLSVGRSKLSPSFKRQE